MSVGSFSTASELVDCGWTRVAIRTFLGEPDRAVARKGRFGRYVRHEYDDQRVRSAMRRKAFRTWLASPRNEGRVVRDPLAHKREAARWAKLAVQRFIRARSRELRAAAKAERVEERKAKKQEKLLLRLDDETILAMAPRCLHAENRRAKHVSQSEQSRIYAVKDAYLRARIACGAATVEGFSVDGWYGPRVCYVVDLGEGHRFHSWSLAGVPYAAIPPHEFRAQPKQVPRVIIGQVTLAPASLQTIIERATELLFTRGLKRAA